MAKGGNNQRSNGSRFSKPYDASNSFVKKVAQRVSGYLGGWFGTPSKHTDDSAPPDGGSGSSAPDTTVTSHRLIDTVEPLRCTTGTPSGYLENLDPVELPAKRIKLAPKGKYDIDFPISPIPTTSGVYQSSVNHNFAVQSNDNFLTSAAGPSGLQNQQYTQNSIDVHSSTTNAEVKANGANDDHSESSESTSGCSSLVPQSDRLSQSAYVCSSRKKNLEEKLNYARQLKQSRTSLYLNRSIPVGHESSARRKPSFDVSAYGAPIFDKSSVKEKMVTSPFYCGQTSYGGASAYRRSKCALYPQRNTSLNSSFTSSFTERREGLQLEVKPSHHGSTEDLSNMSHTAKRILEALEQFSTPVNDAKRIPVSTLNPPLGSKRKRFDDLSESRLRLSTPKTPLNPNAGPLITALNVPTVPDLLKLKRLERIQNSTAAAREVAVQKQEYSLPTHDTPSSKRSGKIVTKLKEKDKGVSLEKLEEVSLPKISLPITTLPKFELQLPTVVKAGLPAVTPAPTSVSSNFIIMNTKSALPSAKAPVSTAFFGSRNFTFSPPITFSVPPYTERSYNNKSNFTFSHPLSPEKETNNVEKSATPSPLTNFMTNEALSKLKRKSDSNIKSTSDLKTGSVMDILGKNIGSDKKVESKSFGDQFKPSADTWECSTCLIRNLNDIKNCAACMTPKPNVSSSNKRTSVSVANEVTNRENKLNVSSEFDKFVKPINSSRSCKECNKNPAGKCSSCDSSKSSSVPNAEPKVETKPFSTSTGFGDMFKKKAGQWECSVCMIQNKENDVVCVACETPKPGAEASKPEPPKFNFGVPLGAGGFKFGIDKAGDTQQASDAIETKSQTNGPLSNPPSKSVFGNTISTPVGVFTFGIPPTKVAEKETQVIETKKVSNAMKPELKVDSSTMSLEASKPSDNGFSLPISTGNESKGATLFGSPNYWPQQSSSNQSDDIVEIKPDPIKNNSTKTENESVKSFTFGSSNAKVFKSPVPVIDNKVVSISVGTTAIVATNPPKFSFGASSTTGKFPSTTSTTFGKPQISTSEGPAGNTTTQSATLQINSTESSAKVEESAKSPKSISSLPTTTAPSASFGFPTMFNNSVSSPTEGGKLSNSFFGNGSSATVTPFGNSTSTFGTSSGFNGPLASSTATSAFGQAAATTTTTTGAFGQVITTTSSISSATNTTQPFAGAFGAAKTPFTSSISTFASPVTTPSATSATPTPFGGFGSSTPAFGAPQTPSFGSTNPSPAPLTFGSGFTGTSTPNTPFKASTPFIFGSNSINNTTANAAPLTASPAVFTFGSSKTETKAAPFGTTFGQNGQKSQFAFGTPSAAPATAPASAPAPAPNMFGGFGEPKTDTPFGASNPTFGNSGSISFGQSSAPATFGSTTSTFEFGTNSSQPQATPQPFQFGANVAQQQPSNPATTFSLNVPHSFNFTGGQTPSFSANQSPSPAPPRNAARRVIKAIRRTQR